MDIVGGIPWVVLLLLKIIVFKKNVKSLRSVKRCVVLLYHLTV